MEQENEQDAENAETQEPENEEKNEGNDEGELREKSSEEKEVEEKEVKEKDEKESEDQKDEPEEESTKDEEKVVKTAKITKTDKKEGSESPKNDNKKLVVDKDTPRIKSDIVVQELDLLTVVSFNKEYFEQTIADTLDLTTTEIKFYDEQNGFNGDSAYAQNNIDFFALDCQSDCWGNIYLRSNAVQIEQFRR